MIKKAGFSISETIIVLSLIGLLAITMLGLNNFGDWKQKISSTKLAQTEQALQHLSKSMLNVNETGLGISNIIKDQKNLNRIISKNFNITKTEPKTAEIISYTLNNNVNLIPKFISNECNISQGDKNPCAIFELSIDKKRKTLCLFDSGISDICCFKPLFWDEEQLSCVCPENTPIWNGKTCEKEAEEQCPPDSPTNCENNFTLQNCECTCALSVDDCAEQNKIFNAQNCECIEIYCPEDSTGEYPNCVCNNEEKEYFAIDNKCLPKCQGGTMYLPYLCPAGTMYKKN